MAKTPDSNSPIEIPGPWQHRYVAANGARFHVAESAPRDANDPPLVVLPVSYTHLTLPTILRV